MSFEGYLLRGVTIGVRLKLNPHSIHLLLVVLRPSREGLFIAYDLRLGLDPNHQVTAVMVKNIKSPMICL